jgi:alpha-galactosidase
MVRDLWAKSDLGNYSSSFSASVPSHGVVMLKITSGGTATTTEPTPVATPVSTLAPTGILGDVNNSGTIDIVDALLVAQYYVGLNPSNFNVSLADVNCSGGIDIVDALLIAQRYVGLISSFPC